MKNLFLFFTLLTTLAFIQSCEKEPQEEEIQNLVAPELPPADMFTMPISEVRETDTDTTAQTGGGVTYWNWAHAALSLVGWNTVVYLNMVVPTTAFAHAFNAEATYIGNLTFQWVYQYQGPQNLGGHFYDVSLTGQYINNTQEVAWTMTVSQVGGFSDFVWYTGVTASGNTEGSFILNRNPANPEPYLRMDYQDGLLPEDGTLRFTNVIPADPANGQYLEYRVDSAAEFNRAFDVQGPPNNFLEIRWSEPAGNGQVRHPQRFNDNEWHCWDTEQRDVDCE
ncbi:hypothetical protein [Lewinella cohaerens]|uniref:hypothetical protein n=1 Tax=Lewinella cohaerens TaxID=70995 RepID=UPI00037F0A2E|nr:hypothetical protein [Lewinella cohaerens]